ncbi:MAG: hypothetical protein IT557_14405 [Alphaproteobacteria bacterium]|nr:hypothetical protein [Alphaproteobacteria bacterium]
MPKVEAAVKSQFFSYFTIDGQQTKHRIHRQVWNDGNTVIVIQGPSWDGNGINGFGKRHLLSTENGHFAGDAEGKAKKIVTKRMGGTGTGARSNKMRAMVSAFAPRPDNMRDESVRTKYAEKVKRVETQLGKGYATNAYGPNTSVCTFVMLDGLTLAEAAKYFGDALRAANIAEGEDKHVDIVFDTPRVMQVEHNSATTYFYAISVSVKRHNGRHHVYHCNGPRMPAPYAP